MMEFQTKYKKQQIIIKIFNKRVDYTYYVVYNINKGYAVFKQINILTKNENYAIIETKTTYGISLYDHIALDGSKVKENQLVVK